MNERQQAVYQIVLERPGYTEYDIAQALGCTKAQVSSDLATLEAMGILLSEHPKYTGIYPFYPVGNWLELLLGGLP